MRKSRFCFNGTATDYWKREARNLQSLVILALPTISSGLKLLWPAKPEKKIFDTVYIIEDVTVLCTCGLKGFLVTSGS